MNNIIIGVACDHAGFNLKTKVLLLLKEKDIKVLDFGTNSLDSVDYPDFVHPLASKLNSGEINIGILICGSGNGVNITANKYENVRSALCWLPEIASLAKQHNNANCIAIPARFVSESLAFDIINAFLKADFEGGRHQKRIDKIRIC